MFAALCIMFLWFSPLHGQTTPSIPHTTESFNDFVKRCYGTIMLKFVKESFAEFYTEKFGEYFTKQLSLPDLEGSFEREGVTGTVTMTGGKAKVEQLVRESFHKTAVDPVQFTFCFTAPMVECNYAYKIVTSDGHDLEGSAIIRLTYLKLNLSSSVQEAGAGCSIPKPILHMFVDPENYLVVFPEKEGPPEYATLVNSYLGRHVAKLIIALKEMLISPMTGEVWQRASSEVKPPFPVPRLTNDPPNAFCYALQEVKDDLALGAEEREKCPIV